jgi:Tfp pilus assembly protein PilE
MEEQVNQFGLVVLIIVVAAVAVLGMWLQGTGFRDYLRRRRGER